MSNKPVPDAAPGIHEKVFELCMKLKCKDVLDAPAGPGALSKRLADAGCNVLAVDIDKSCSRLGDYIEYKQGDLNCDLDFPSASFDCVVCVEGIEHIEDIYNLFREFYRVLKPEGRLIVTTPNVQSVISRIKFLLFGSYRTFDSRIKISQGFSAHIHPVTFTELEYALSKSGLNIETITTNAYQIRWGWARSLVASLFRSGNLIFNRSYNPILCTSDLLCGETLIVQARKGT